MFLPNLGFEHPWYYYGQYNRVRGVIETLPGVKITHDRLHKDTSLEDFGFTLNVNGKTGVVLNVWEDSKMAMETDRTRLRTLIQKEIYSNN